LGYKVINGKIEDEVHFYKRMSGVLNLYFTLLIALNTKNSSIDGIKRAWNWLADVLNMTPRPEITAEMLTAFFKCCGYYLKRVYGNQFLKLLKICFEDFMQLIKLIPVEKQSVASVGRLQSIYDTFLKTREFTEWKKY
jgi:nucleoporin GLE1